MSAELDTRITDLEVKVAFQERTIETLSSLIREQHSQIDDLQVKLAALLKRYREGEADIDASRPKPPHY